MAVDIEEVRAVAGLFVDADVRTTLLSAAREIEKLRTALTAEQQRTQLDRRVQTLTRQRDNANRNARELARAVRNAPHAFTCRSNKFVPGPCTCWKAEVS